ncbi:phospholipase A [Halomonas sp. TRM85114]|uniref:phospholipase A n=1 Tax=Halomonas jincaotanensis TaxID=2810616 RepID=UPI001BD40C6B|nr:phospholipase A [Halomonas jincaotanensis]MBS9405269.1 phospholipase A [Halomonas jincaotanensis]
MNVTRSLALLALSLTLGLQTLAVQAQSQPLSEAERAEIQSRIESLNSELESLHRQLSEGQRHSAPSSDSLQAAPASQDPDVSPAPEEEELASVQERRELEKESALNPFSITTHRRNYLLPLTYNLNTNDQGFSAGDPDRAEVKFQFSAKFGLVDDFFGDAGGDLYFAYTQRSWWQAYNTDASSPFRETNYEPEVFIDFDTRWSLLGWTNINNRLGFNHQSNGRSVDQSRSWNRLTLQSTFLNDDWAVTVAPHWRIPETEADDDNPDIHHYMGYGDVTVAHRFNTDQEISMLVRGSPRHGNMGAQLDYSWPLFGNVRGHVQYYSGYGESLIDYDHRTDRLGIGFSLNPLFSGNGLDH